MFLENVQVGAHCSIILSDGCGWVILLGLSVPHPNLWESNLEVMYMTESLQEKKILTMKTIKSNVLKNFVGTIHFYYTNHLNPFVKLYLSAVERQRFNL